MANVLAIYASPRGEQSNSKSLAQDLAAKLGGSLTERELIDSDLPFVTNELIGAYFSSPDQHTEDQKRVITDSDRYVKELQAADTLIIATPMYNFTVPATLKTWIDLVARAGVTFKYTENGPVGLLENKKAYIVATTGGTPIGSDYDMLTPYLKLFLGFIGITDVTVISADGLMGDAAAGLKKAESEIAAV